MLDDLTLRPAETRDLPQIIGLFVADELGSTREILTDPLSHSEPQIIAQRVSKQLHPGAIILLHDGGGERSNTVNADF